MLRPLLALAALAFPSEFRRDYRAQLFLDLEHRESERWYALRLFLDVITAGIMMRFDLLRGDVVYAIRVLANAPLYTGIVAGTLAVAIGANAVVFSALEAVLLRPLPYAHADRLALLASKPKGGPAPSGTMWVPGMTFVDALQRSALIEAAGSAMPTSDPVRVNGNVETLHRAFVTPTYFSTLGVTPYIGRFFTGTGAYDQIVISYTYWQTHYAGRSSAIGKLLKINDSAFTIAGVAPASMADPVFGFIQDEDVWTLVPRVMRGSYGAFPVIRMRPRVTIAQMRAEIARIWHDGAGHDSDLASSSPYLQPLSTAVFDNARAIWTFFVAVIAVLLIACANVANLMIARAAARRDEFAARSALGATPRRIVAQCITEALALSLFGCGLGLALGFACLRPALTLMPGNLPRLQSTHFGWTVVLYVFILAIAITLIAGILPALRAGSKSIGFRRGSRMRAALVAFEVGAAFALVVCSGLLLRSFVALTSQHLGFDPHRVYVASFLPHGPAGAADSALENSFNYSIVASRMLERIRSLPEVESVAISVHVPFVETFVAAAPFWREGEQRHQSDELSHTSMNSPISPSYLDLMHIPVLQGRALTNADVHGPNVMLVNRAFVRQFFKSRSALGKRMFTEQHGLSLQIVGIVGDTRDSLTQVPQPMAYTPFSGNPFFQIVMRTRTDDPSLAAQIAKISQQTYPRFGVPPVESMEAAIRDSTSNAHAAMLLLASLTLIALILAMAGIYGVVAFSVERRYHEIGVRVALGSTRGAILRSVVGSAALQSVVGIAPGIVVAALAARGLESELYQTAPFDPASFIGAIVLILACTAIAAALPAVRAMNIEPARTLRYE